MTSSCRKEAVFYWCEENNEHAVSERFLGLRLKELGFEQRRSNDGTVLAEYRCEA